MKKKSPEQSQEAIQTEQASPEEQASQEQPAVEILTVEDELAKVKSELEAVQNQANEYLDGWQRARAEFTNYKRRVDQNQVTAYQNTVGNIVKRYLDISDDLERALRKRPKDGAGAKWAEGIELIYRKLLAAYEADGVKVMEVDGQFFDPNQHEAIMQEDSIQHESGQIIEVVQPGYVLGDRVLRPARVRVAR